MMARPTGFHPTPLLVRSWRNEIYWLIDQNPTTSAFVIYSYMKSQTVLQTLAKLHYSYAMYLDALPCSACRFG
jgi:hypothetical protein